MRTVIVLAFVCIFASLGSALFHLMRDKGQSNRTVNALMLRVGLSIGLFLFILVAYHFGWIHSTGLPLPLTTP